MLFRVLIFALLVAAGYYYAQKIRGNTYSLTLVGTLLVVVVVAFFVLSKRLFAMVSFSMYLMLIVLGFAAGILAGLNKKKRQLGQQKSLPSGKNKLNKSD
jgi:uncharacterized membrane protein